MIPQALALVSFEMVDRPGPTLFAQRTGDPVIPDIPGGWKAVDRPKRRAMTDWQGQGLKQMSLPLVFDKWIDNESVEGEITQLITLIEGFGLNPAPIVRIGGLAPLTHLLWTVNAIVWGPDLRRWQDGVRVRQNFTVTLLEYVSPDYVNTVKSSPAQAAAQGATGGSGHTYTVGDGDTLSSIAAAQLGDFNRWTEIATLNDIRDPRAITIGQVIRLP